LQTVLNLVKCYPYSKFITAVN